MEPARRRMIELSAQIVITALASGALVGLLLSVFGGGGSVLAAPLLLYAVGVRDPHVAIGTASAAVAANAAFNLVGHWRGGRVKWPCAIVFGVSGLAGSLAGSSLAKAIDGRHLLIAFAIAMAAIALSMLRTPKNAGDPDVAITVKRTARLAPLGLLTGLAAGFFGIGGGFLIVPGLMLAAGMTIANAAASSLVSVALFGAATSMNYAVSGLVDWRLAGLLLLGGAAGGMTGIGLVTRLGADTLWMRRGFAGMVLLVAFYVAWNAVAAL
ncbi:MAG: sulfite exporter TauE/SafE family protein [Hyphomonadaceae bacterium]